MKKTEMPFKMETCEYIIDLPRLRINVWANFDEFLGTFYCSVERSPCINDLSVAMLKCWNQI